MRPAALRGVGKRVAHFAAGAIADEADRVDRFPRAADRHHQVPSGQVGVPGRCHERRTSSRVNALRTRVVPGLESETRAIALVLEQREREDRFRLKRVKETRRRRTIAAGG